MKLWAWTTASNLLGEAEDPGVQPSSRLCGVTPVSLTYRSAPRGTPGRVDGTWRRCGVATATQSFPLWHLISLEASSLIKCGEQASIQLRNRLQPLHQDDDMSDPDQYDPTKFGISTLPLNHEPYGAILPERLAGANKGKLAVVTGAGRGMLSPCPHLDQS